MDELRDAWAHLSVETGPHRSRYDPSDSHAPVEVTEDTWRALHAPALQFAKPSDGHTLLELLASGFDVSQADVQPPLASFGRMPSNRFRF